MEILIKKLQNHQQDLEDALRMEITYEECRADKYGKRLLRYIRSKRRTVDGVIEILTKYTIN